MKQVSSKKLKSYKLQAIRGAVALSATLLISAIIMEITIVGVIVSSTLVNTANNEKLSAEAFRAAQAGIQDGLIKIVRYCSLADNSACSPGSYYTITVGTRSVDITIDTASTSPRKITSTGSAGLVKKRVQAILSINASTGEVGTQSIKECKYSSSSQTSC